MLRLRLLDCRVGRWEGYRYIDVRLALRLGTRKRNCARRWKQGCACTSSLSSTFWEPAWITAVPYLPRPVVHDGVQGLDELIIPFQLLEPVVGIGDVSQLLALALLRGNFNTQFSLIKCSLVWQTVLMDRHAHSLMGTGQPYKSQAVAQSTGN